MVFKTWPSMLNARMFVEGFLLRGKVFTIWLWNKHSADFKKGLSSVEPRTTSGTFTGTAAADLIGRIVVTRNQSRLKSCEKVAERTMDFPL